MKYLVCFEHLPLLFQALQTPWPELVSTAALFRINIAPRVMQTEGSRPFRKVLAEVRDKTNRLTQLSPCPVQTSPIQSPKPPAMGYARRLKQMALLWAIPIAPGIMGVYIFLFTAHREPTCGTKWFGLCLGNEHSSITWVPEKDSCTVCLALGIHLWATSNTRCLSSAELGGDLPWNKKIGGRAYEREINADFFSHQWLTSQWNWSASWIHVFWLSWLAV